MPTAAFSTVFCWMAIAASSWPGFLGAGATPVDPESVPLEWNFDKNIAWQTSTPGFGQSSPVIWNDRVYVTSVEGPQKDKYHLTCLTLADGKILWTQTIDNSSPVENSLYVSRAAPTPCVDDTGVYAFFEGGDLLACTHAGERLWQRSFVKDYGPLVNEFGLASSPLQRGDALILLVDHEGPSYLIAVSKKDGKTVWKTDRTGRRSWSSPSLMDVAGEPVIICSSTGSVDAYSANDGKRLASLTDVGGNTASTPLPVRADSFLVGASAGQSGENAEAAKQSNMEVQLVRADNEFELKPQWRAKAATPSFGSPMTYRGFAYWVNKSGVVYCLDATTGEQKYAQRVGQSCWATPVGLGDRVYFFGKDGQTTVLEAGPEFRILAQNQLWDPQAPAPASQTVSKEKTEGRQRGAATFGSRTQFGVALVTGTLLIRTGETLYCIRKPSTK